MSFGSKSYVFYRFEFGNQKDWPSNIAKSRYPIMEVSEVTQDIMPIGGPTL